MFESSIYGLSNPALTEDIGMANLNRMFPIPVGACCYIPGVSDCRNEVRLQGPLSNDTLTVTQKEKDKKTWKTILIVGGLTLACTFGFKHIKNGAIKCWNGLKNLFGKLKPQKNTP